MSYILDALKKAESERERGAVPGLNSAQANQSTFIHYGSDQKPWWLVALVLVLSLALVVAVWAWRQTAAPASAVVVASPPVALAPIPTPMQTPDPTPVPTQAQTPVRQPSIEAKAPVASVQKPGLPVRAPLPAPVAAAAPVAAKTKPVEVAASSVAHVQAKVAPASVSPTRPAAPAPVPAAPVMAASVEAASKPAPISAPIRSASGGIPMLSELPEPMRRQIPAVNISGAVFSDSPPEWTLIINDQLMGKGGMVAPDMRLEEISGSSAVFNFKGQRFRIDR